MKNMLWHGLPFRTSCKEGVQSFQYHEHFRNHDTYRARMLNYGITARALAGHVRYILSNDFL